MEVCQQHPQLVYQAERQEKKLDDHEQRLRILEKAHWRMTAVVALITAICSSLAAAGGAIVVAVLKP